MSEPVHVEDVFPPSEPKTDIDYLKEYLEGRYRDRKEDIFTLLRRAKDLDDKGTLIELVYESLLFRGELDEWISYSNQVLEEVHGDQLGLAHSEQASEAKERGSSRPLSKLVEARADQFSAPLRRVVGELKATREWLDKTLFWCQAQPKFIRDEEYGDILQSKHSPPEERFNDEAVVHPPSAARDLSRMRRSG